VDQCIEARNGSMEPASVLPNFKLPHQLAVAACSVVAACGPDAPWVGFSASARSVLSYVILHAPVRAAYRSLRAVWAFKASIGAAVGGYLGLNVAALSAGIMFGVQPLIAHDASGHALYAPYPLKLAVPAMAIEHLLVFGLVEGLVTGLVVAYLQRTDPSLLHAVPLKPVEEVSG